MEESRMQELIAASRWPRLMAALALGMLAIFLLVLIIGEVMSYRYIGAGITPTNTIQVDGEGQIVAVPDTATFSVTVEDSAADVATAQSKATTQANTIINYLVGQGVASSSIQTTDYEINPQYSYSQAACPAAAGDAVIYCPPGKQTLTGYQVSETLSVKVTDTSKAGTLLSGVGSKGASSVSGLTFTSSNQDDLQAQARDKAIAQAQGKAQDLAKSLGVQIVGVVGFSENQSGIEPTPVRFATAGAASAAVAPQIPAGQNTITDDVTVTYEIR